MVASVLYSTMVATAQWCQVSYPAGGHSPVVVSVLYSPVVATAQYVKCPIYSPVVATAQ